MDRLRNRDLRTNNNKCYTMYFDDDQNKDITNKSAMPVKKIKSKSPRKREPTKNIVDQVNNESNDLIETSALSFDKITPDVTGTAVAATNSIDTNAVNSEKVLDFSVKKNITLSDALKEHITDDSADNGKEIVTVEMCNGQNENDRKRRLSNCNEENEDDDEARSNEAESISNCNKRKKLEFSKEQMIQVRFFFEL